MPFHLYLTEPIDPAAFPNILDGLTIRTTPIYRPFFASMGATLIQTAPGEVFTALERGTVEGYGWPISSIHDLGWDPVTEYRVDPGFYNAAVEILVNLDTWNSLTDEQKAVLFEARDWLETVGVREDIEIMNADRERQRESGIEVFNLGPQYLARAIDTGWEAIIEANPETGPRLRELFR